MSRPAPARASLATDRSENSELALLESLLAATRASFDAFRAASDKAASHDLKARLGDRALERDRVIALLGRQVRLLGGEPAGFDVPGANEAAAMFAPLRSVVVCGGEDEVLDTVRRGETWLAGRFDEAIEDPRLSSDTREVIDEAQRLIAAGCHALLAQAAHRY